MNLALSKQNFVNNFVINQFCYCISAPRTDWNWAKHSDRRVDKFIKIGLEEMLEEIDRENRSEANRTTGFEKKNMPIWRSTDNCSSKKLKKTLLVKIGKFLFPNATDAMEFNPYIHHPFICNPDYVTPPHVDLFNLIPRNPPSPFIMSYVILYTTSPVIPPILRLYFPSLKAFARSLPGHRYR